MHYSYMTFHESNLQQVKASRKTPFSRENRDCPNAIKAGPRANKRFVDTAIETKKMEKHFTLYQWNDYKIETISCISTSKTVQVNNYVNNYHYHIRPHHRGA